MEKKDIFDRIMSCPALVRWEPVYRRHREVLLYLFFGGLTTVISIGTYAAAVVGGLDPLAANIISWVLAVLFAYVTNSIWVFDGHTGSLKEKLGQMAGFYGGRVATLVMEEIVLFVFINLLHRNEFLVKVAAQFLVLTANYLISKLLVFRRK